MNLHPTEKQFELEFSVELRTRDPTNFRETDFLNRFDDELLDRILIDSSAKCILQFRRPRQDFTRNFITNEFN